MEGRKQVVCFEVFVCFCCILLGTLYVPYFLYLTTYNSSSSSTLKIYLFIAFFSTQNIRSMKAAILVGLIHYHGVKPSPSDLVAFIVSL